MNGDKLEGYLKQSEANPPKNASFRVKTSNPSDLFSPPYIRQRNVLKERSRNSFITFNSESPQYLFVPTDGAPQLSAFSPLGGAGLDSSFCSHPDSGCNSQVIINVIIIRFILLYGHIRQLFTLGVTYIYIYMQPSKEPHLAREP